MNTMITMESNSTSSNRSPTDRTSRSASIPSLAHPQPFGYSQLVPVSQSVHQIPPEDNNNSRGLSALQKRAQQLKKWQEYEEYLNNLDSGAESTGVCRDVADGLNGENVDPKARNGSLSQQYYQNHNKRSSSGSSASSLSSGVKHHKPSSPKIRFSDKTLFLAACANNDIEECKRLLESTGIDINVVNVDGMTGLHQACIDDNLEMVQFLVQNGADLNACDNDGWTPLHATASCGHYSIAEYLLESGADPTIANNDGELSCDISDTEELEELILKKFKELAITNLDELRCREVSVMNQDINNWIASGTVDDKPHPRTGASILHVAASKGYNNILTTLVTHSKIKNQFNLEVVDNEKWTPLAAAVYWQQPGSIEILLDAGADVNFKTASGQRLEDLTDNEVIVKIIENHRKKLIEDQRIREQKLLDSLKQRRESLNSLSNGILPTPPSVPSLSSVQSSAGSKNNSLPAASSSSSQPPPPMVPTSAPPSVSIIPSTPEKVLLTTPLAIGSGVKTNNDISNNHDVVVRNHVTESAIITPTKGLFVFSHSLSIIIIIINL